MTTATLERVEMHKIIDEIPEDKKSILLGFMRFLREEDDDYLSEQDIEELDIARAEMEAGDVVPWEEAKKRLEALP